MKAAEMSNSYIDFLINNHKFSDINDNVVELQTPFVDSFGDNISMIIQKKSPSTYRVSDQGYTIWNIEAHGINMTKSGAKRTSLLHSVLDFEGVSLDQDLSIFKETSPSKLSQAIHEVSQAIVKVSSLSLSNRKNSSAIFYDEVASYFEERRFTEFNFAKGLYIPGKHTVLYKSDYTFTLPSSIKFTKMYNTINKNTHEIILGIYTDTKDFIEQQNGKFCILFNGNDSSTNPDLIESLKGHEVEVVNFYNKEDVLDSFGIKSA